MSAKPFDGQTCSNCRYFIGPGVIENPVNDEAGECRIRAPLIPREPMQGEERFGSWPLVSLHEWCGEWRGEE